MQKIHPRTTLALVFDLAALTLFATGYVIPALLLSVLGFFSAISELNKFTSIYQFLVIFLSALFIGLFIELPIIHFPFFTLAMVITALCCLTRIMFFKVFGYTSYAWFEPVMVLLSVIIV